jgi:hypothetical protein
MTGGSAGQAGNTPSVTLLNNIKGKILPLIQKRWKAVLTGIGFILLLWFIIAGGAIILGILLIALAIWFASGFGFVPRNEFGAKYFFEKMLPEGKTAEQVGKASLFSLFGFCESGLYWTPRLPRCGIHRLPKARFELQYPTRTVISKEISDEDDKTQRFGKQVLSVDGTIYCEFEKTLKAAIMAIERKMPITEEGLLAKTDGLIDDALRAAIGGMPWFEATEFEGREKIRKSVMESVKDQNSYFALGGINLGTIDVNIRKAVPESTKLKEAMTQPDIERYLALSSRHEAQRVLTEASVLAGIRKALLDKGFSPEKVDEIAHSVYELQVASDLQRETGKPVVRLTRFEGGDTLAPLIGKIFASIAEGKSLTEEDEKKEPKSTQKDKDRASGHAADRKRAKKRTPVTITFKNKNIPDIVIGGEEEEEEENT